MTDDRFRVRRRMIHDRAKIAARGRLSGGDEQVVQV